ncbi:MAG: hypothetical protein K2X37_09260 [Chitinophagaceae bacterium]|nr:hypothetical protein [Chitinophagaceae bacterium]
MYSSNAGDAGTLSIKKESTLRVFIGLSGILLPVILWLVVFIIHDYYYPLPSISHYFYTRANPYFSVVIGFIALSLIIYKGYDNTDFIICTMAGIAALVVIALPTHNLAIVEENKYASYSITTLPVNKLRETIHLIAAGIFLICLAIMSGFQFTKTEQGLQSFKTKEKKFRNGIYILSALIIVFSIVSILLGSYGIIIPERFYISNHLTFWLESFAVWAFGFAWLVKGEAVFADK